jgi:CBS domain-containing protein
MIEKVITYDPYCVSSDDSAIDALITMIENHFRHLPVVDSEGAVIGVLDIGKCLDDAIAQLEFSIGQKATDNALKSLDDGTEDGELQTLLAALFAQSVDEKPRTLRSILTGKPSTIVSPTTTIRVAGCLMAESRHAALVVDEGQLIGIFGFKDMMSRAIACQLPLDTTPIVDVMTPQPEFLSPDQTVLDALQTMYDSKCLTLPVCESDGSVVGSVDVFDVIFGCGGTAGWRSVFKSAMNTDETVSCEQPTKALEIVPRARVQLPGEHLNSSPNIPQTLILQDGGSFVGSGLDLFPSGHFTNTTEERTHGQTAELAVFKVTDASNGAHRVKCPTLIAKLVTMVSHRINVPEESIQLKYVDDDGDEVEITSNEDVAEAWALALQSGSKAVKLIVTTKGKRTNTLQRTVYGLGAAAAVSGIVYALFLTMNRKRS